MLKILQISDLHVLPAATDTLLGVNTEYYFRKVLEVAHAEQGPFDLILVTGDLAQHPSPSNYRRILHLLQSYSTTTLCMPGNHDDFDLMQDILNDGQVSCRKQLLLKDWQIICLNSQKPNSPGGTLTREELGFLEACLKEQPEMPTLIALHHHCIATGCDWLDTMQVENSEDLLDLAGRHRQVKAIVYGHVHQDISTRHAGIDIVSAPATCFQFDLSSAEFTVEDSPSGYRIFECDADGSLRSASYRLSEPPRGLMRDAHSF